MNLKSHTCNMFCNRTSEVTETAYLLNHCYYREGGGGGLSIGNGKVIGTIFIDFRKVFDSVDNNS